jgi:2-polyprenyl-3-methyl-5-hydroxy-6-metoxy-1,4-benzoquinol methylase
MKMATRFDREKEHGLYLAESVAEVKWGWHSPAGKCRSQRRAKLIIDAIPLRQGLRVLEIGCGTGLFTEQFAKSGCQLRAVDLSSDLISVAKGRLGDNKNVTFELSPFEELSCEDEQLDAIIGSSVLHHLELSEAMKVIYRLLKPGGRIAFAEPNYLNPQIFIERKFRCFFPYVSKDETAFVRFTIARLFRSVGYIDVKVLPFDWLHPSTPSCLIPWVSRMGSVLELFPLIREFSGSLLIQAQKPY